MADLEQRVTTLEREMSALKARVGTNEEDLQNIPELIRTEFRLTNSQIARLSRDVAELQRGLGDLTSKVGDLPEKVDALQRVMAEFVVEIRAEIGKKGSRARRLLLAGSRAADAAIVALAHARFARVGSLVRIAAGAVPPALRAPRGPDCGGGSGFQEARQRPDAGRRAVLVAACLWWFSFYSSVVREIGQATGPRGQRVRCRGLPLQLERHLRPGCERRRPGRQDRLRAHAVLVRPRRPGPGRADPLHGQAERGGVIG